MVRTEISDLKNDESRTPSCPHFEGCGSCQLQHLSLAAYHARKEGGIKTVMRENGLVPTTWLPTVFIGEGTRRRVTFSALRTGDSLTVGFHRYHDNDIEPVADCLLLTPGLQTVYRKLQSALLPLLPRDVPVDILLQEADEDFIDCVISGLSERDEARLGAKQTATVAALAEACGIRRVSFREKDFAVPRVQIELGRPTKTSGALKVDLFPGAFLQPSKDGEAALSAAVLNGLGKRSKKDKVLDLFSGCGTFAGRILDICSVHAVEGDAGMAKALTTAAKGHTRFTAEFRDLSKEPVSARELRGYAAVVFDPPRAGAKEQCRKLAASDVPLVVGVSCNPATFARDAKILSEGGYTLDTLQIIDQFTYTTHAEIVGVFRKEG